MIAFSLMSLPREAQNRFLILWESSREHLVKYVRGKLDGVPTYQDCEDIVEEAFVRIMERYDSYRDLPDGTLKAIVIRTCENLCLNERRRSGRIAFSSADDPEQSAEAEETAGREERTPEEVVVSGSAVRQIREILLSMPSPQRDALQMRILEEKPYSVIAGELGVSEDTARQRVKRARDELIRRLKEAGYEP